MAAEHMIRRSVDTKKTAPKLISERRSAESDSMGINCDMSEGRGGGLSRTTISTSKSWHSNTWTSNAQLMNTSAIAQRVNMKADASNHTIKG